ncbi:Zinc ion binding protein [Phytophthora palmivora]|uniref:Zinc ion binding protein n=1 Tax=Phytophthora palmivora TaxID=4796 RepID=A0A2P4X595_9STRA|nr:Zinc ion binding protein [Phytophthora palmivora]
MEDTPSFTFTTPEQHHQRFSVDENDTNSEDWHFRNGPSPITAPRFQGEEQDESKADDPSWNFAHSHFRRRNRLETRLEELQKDVASLTLKLRATGNRSTSLDASSVLYTSKEQEDINSHKDQGRVNNTVKMLRELHQVTTERDQLRFELEKAKKELVVAEKKCQDAMKSRKAYDKLKAHCDSLQESLDLSERIRVRQKKLLQQEQGFMHAGYDILDSLVASSHQDEEEHAGLATHEQAPSEPTAAASRSRTPRSVLKTTTPTTKQHRSDFDSLLQVDAPQFSTRRPSRIATSSTRRPSQTQVQQRDAMRQAARWARSRGAAVDISTSTTQMPTRRTPIGRPKNSFLAPTQASLRRAHELPRRGDHERPPFVV